MNSFTRTLIFIPTAFVLLSWTALLALLIFVGSTDSEYVQELILVGFSSIGAPIGIFGLIVSRLMISGKIDNPYKPKIKSVWGLMRIETKAMYVLSRGVVSVGH